MFSKSAASVVLIAGSVAATNLTTIIPCTSCPYNVSVAPITVTSQYQPVSTCVPTTSGNVTKYPFETYKYVSTVIPCAFNSSAGSSTTVTKTDQLVTVSRFRTTVTSLSTPAWPRHAKPTPVYSTIGQDYVLPYNEIGPLAIPGYGGSGLCTNCGPDAKGVKHQPIPVTDCTAGPAGTSCVQYTKTLVSSSAPAATSTTSAVLSTSFSAPSAGSYTFSFPQTAPAKTITADGQAYTLGPQNWNVFATRWFGHAGPSNYVTTVTTTITQTVPASTSPATATYSAAVPPFWAHDPFGRPWGHPWDPSSPSTTASSSSWLDWSSSSTSSVPSSSSSSSSSSWTTSTSTTSFGPSSTSATTTSSPPSSSSTTTTPFGYPTTTSSSSTTTSSPSSSSSTTTTTSYGYPTTTSSSSTTITSTTSSSNTTITTTSSTTASTTSGTTSAPALSAIPATVTPIYMSVNIPNARYRKRTAEYVSFAEGGDAVLVSDIGSASTFKLYEGYMIDLGTAEYVGTDATSGAAALEEFADAASASDNWASSGGSLSFGDVTFCYNADNQMFIVFPGAATPSGCITVVLAAAPASTTTTTTTTTTTSSTAPSQSSELEERELESQEKEVEQPEVVDKRAIRRRHGLLHKH